MINQSVWQGSFKQYPALSEDIERETVVVGGGLAGILTAFRLSEEGKSVTLIEADRLCAGTTGKTTGKISCNQEAVYFELYKKYGKQTAEKYYLSQKNAQENYIKLIEKYNIECDLKKADSYILTDGDGEKLKINYELLKSFGADCEWIENLQPFNAKYALKMKDEYVFDVLKFVSRLSENFEIFENTRAVKIDCDANAITTEKAEIKAKNIIIATRYPIINVHGLYIVKLRQSQSYLSAVNKKCIDNAYLELRADGVTMRPFSDGTIVGGGDHRCGRCDSRNKFEELEEYAKSYFNVDKLTHAWSAEDVMTADGMPMVGKYWKKSNGIYVITGFNKWGMTNSLASADVICDLLLNRNNENIKLFAPNRKIKGALADYVKNSFVTFKDVFSGYFKITFKNEKSVKVGHGKIVRYRGKKRAVYRDSDGNLHVIGRMCPHMHGELKWNKNSKCWECPCHGSQFDMHGNIISAPATKSCKTVEK